MDTNKNICPICGEGHLEEVTGINEVEYKGHFAELDLHYLVCDVCGSEQSNSAQLRTNKRAMVAFKKCVDGLLSGKEVRAIRERLGVSQAEAAQIFGGGPVAFSKYETDDVAQSEAMDKLLRIVDAAPEVISILTQNVADEAESEIYWTSVEIKKPTAKRPRLEVIGSSQPEPEQGWRKAG